MKWTQLAGALVALLPLCVAAVAQDWAPEPGDLDPEVNVALGKRVQYAPLPGYRLTAKNDTDPTDLTDGALSDHPRGHLWFESKCVGWSYGGRCNLAVDLEEVHPVREVAIRIQGGSPQPGITTPVWMELLVSDDGELYRLAGEYSTFREGGALAEGIGSRSETQGDNEKFEVPAYEGTAWVHRFRFTDLRTRARFVGLRLYASGLTVSDEMYVFRGDHDPARCDMAALPVADFSVSRPQVYFHKPYVCFTTNLATPNPVGIVVPPGAEAEDVAVALDLPKGTRLLGGGFGDTDLASVAGEEVEGGAFLRYQFPAVAKASTKTWGRIFVGGNWEDGQEGELRYRLTLAGGEQTPLASVPLRAIEVPPTPQPQQLVVGLSWYSLDALRKWPDGLDAFRALGMNTVSSFVHWMQEDEQWEFWDQCAEQGFKRLNIDSTFHRVAKQDEVYCQFEDGTHGSRLCPSYRGEYYDKEIRRVAEQCARAKPDYLFCDVELWSWRGPVDSRKCTRCQEDFANSGLETWEQWQVEKGTEMWTDAAKAVQAAVKEAGGPEIELGVYDWRAGKQYQFTWDFDRLYPEHLQSSQVSTYTPLFPYHLTVIGDECREDRQSLPKADVLPWITPGDAGTFTGDSLRYALLECFANGARGMNFWSGRLWDAELLVAYARVVRNVAAVEGVIISGELLEGAEVEAPARVSGIVSGDEMVVLVADYLRPAPTEVSVKLPVQKACVAVDLDTGETVGEIAPGQALTVPLPSERARLLHVLPG